MTTPCTILQLVNGEVTGCITGVNLELGIVLKHHGLNGHESEQTLGDSEGQGIQCAAVHGVTESWTSLTTIIYNKITVNNNNIACTSSLSHADMQL